MKGNCTPNLPLPYNGHCFRQCVSVPFCHINCNCEILSCYCVFAVFSILGIKTLTDFYSIFDTFALNLQTVLFMYVALHMVVDLIHIALKVREGFWAPFILPSDTAVHATLSCDVCFENTLEIVCCLNF